MKPSANLHFVRYTSISMFTLTPITQPTLDTKHPLLLLQSDHGEKYVFGKIPEGAQRSLTENKIRISKLENIFLTGELNWSSIGGLPGMILTIADQGKDKLVLNYGSDVINYVVSTWRYFVFRFGITLNTNHLTENQPFKDKLITVNPIVIKKHNDNSDGFKKEEISLLKSIVSKMFPKHAPTARYDPSSDPYLNVELPKGNFKQSSTSYEIVFNPIRGRFKVEEAFKLGVPKGPLFAKLTKGQTIVLEDGTTVTPDQVLEKQRNFAKVLIIDVPSNEYIPNFVKFYKNYDKTDLGIVYYFLDDEVVINEDVIRFMELFNNNLSGSQVQHVVSHSKVSPNNISFLGSAITTLKLKALQLENYNLPRTDQLLSKEFFETFSKSTHPGTSMVQCEENPIKSSLENKSVHVLTRKTNVTIEPFTKVDNASDTLNITVVDDSKDFSWKSLFDKHIQPLGLPAITYENLIEEQINMSGYNNNLQKIAHVEVVTLGTGSALPSKYRNVLSTLLKIPKIEGSEVQNRVALFDAGENTIGTLRRMFSSQALKDIFKDLKLIYLSHLHADHHLGIVSILKEWYLYNSENEDSKIYIVTPWQYNKFVQESLLFEIPELLQRIKYISCEHLTANRFVRMETKAISMEDFAIHLLNDEPSTKKRKLELDKTSSFRDLKTIRQMYEDLGIINFQTCPAIHCNWAYSNSITFKINESRKFKVSYSGDTRPNIELFAKGIGRGSDLLIHEATLDNDLVEDAIKKRHCTINEAIEVSNEMGAEKLIMTHFSQRYPKAPQIDGNIEISAKEFCFAFDGMIVDYERLGEQQAILPLLGNLFMEERKNEEKSNELEASV